MANELSTGAGKLVERILADARADAEQVQKDAQARCDAIKADGEKAVAKLDEEQKSATEALVNGILERSRTNAELQSRKEALAARRAVVEEAFEAAYAALRGMSEAERADICRTMLLREADGGETVCAAKADQKGLLALLPAIEADMIRAGKKPLKPGLAAADVEFGFVLQGDGYEKDCSFEALLRDARAQEETAVAEILFD